MSLDIDDWEALPDPDPEAPSARLGRTVSGHAEPAEASNGSSRASPKAAGPTSRPSNPSRGIIEIPARCVVRIVRLIEEEVS